MRVAISTIALLACTSLASAADLGGPYQYEGSIKDGPIAAAPFSWAGLYVGAHAGHAWGEWDGDLTYNDPAFPNLTAADVFGTTGRTLNADGWLGGAQVGFNLQSGSLVYGVEADVSWGDLEDTRTFSTTNGAVDWDVKAKVDAFGTVRGRLGFLARPNLLLYGTGGLAWAQTTTKESVWQAVPLFNSAHGTSEKTHVGWTAGLGGELMLANNWTVKAEWLHVDVGSKHYIFEGSTHRGATHDTDGYKADLTFNVFRVGVNYKFGH